MHTFETRDAARAYARKFEERLPPEQRKQLGQFFSGVPLGKLLAHLALSADTRSVLDPMAGHGDLLDATAEAAAERGFALKRLDAIEIDAQTADVCADRVSDIAQASKALHQTISGSAFDLQTIRRLPRRNYDLVITNPPYVRYQSHNKAAHQAVSRDSIEAIVDERLSAPEKTIWKTLTAGYSGLADLSIPAWLLASLLVHPGGRLAVVVPATWRSREYGDVIRYLLLRCFHLEYIVEDVRPGWFPDALVRTHLVVARRLTPESAGIPLGQRASWPSAWWVTVSPRAASAHSLVGAAFAGAKPEAKFARAVAENASIRGEGIETRPFDLRDEAASLNSRAQRRAWYQKLEGANETALPLLAAGLHTAAATLPPAFHDILGDRSGGAHLRTLAELGINVGQGLRTGCNRFFYVDICASANRSVVRVRASQTFGNREFAAPSKTLRPVLRRQSELPLLANGQVPPGRVLDLHHWVLPEDARAIADAKATYRARREPLPRVMLDDLAAYVREAAATAVTDQSGTRRIPALSAVCTNARPHRAGVITPRFWYMLPEFTPRHLPAAFVARINHETPWVERNLDSPILIDANFSTFWASEKTWTPHALKALLNSAWCRLFMEELGTTLGGGALKLEAVHLRQILMPALSNADRRKLDAEGKKLKLGATDVLARIDRIVLGALAQHRPNVASVIPALAKRAEFLRHRRQKRAV